MAKKIITDAEIEQLHFIFAEIADTAKALHRLAIQSVGEDEPGMIEQTPIIIQTLAEKIGWAANLGGQKLGSCFSEDVGAEAWMMPPAYHDAVKATHA